MTIPSLVGTRLAITGVDGFVGKHLARLASESGARVIGISRSSAPNDDLASYLTEYYSADLRNEWPEGVSAEVVIHLAGRAAVGPSFSSPQEYLTDNSAITTTLFEGLLALGDTKRIIGVSTGAVYAPPSERTGTIEESGRVYCSSPYVVSKLLVENQLEYYRSRGLETVVARPFNHIGPGQDRGFLIPDLLARLKSLGPGEELLVGNLATERDYTDVRDVASAYLVLAAAPELKHSLYNVASGTAVSGMRILELLCEGMGIDMPSLRVDPSLVRPTDIPRIAGSSERLKTELGWSPRISLGRTVSEVIAEHAA